MSSKALDRAPGQDWIAVVRKNGTNEFATAFVAQPSLYASVLNVPCIGVGRIAAFFAATSGMYDTFAFTHETKGGSKTCLEWEGKVFGEDVGGTTILCVGHVRQFWGCKSPVQPDGGEALAKRKGRTARDCLKEAWSKVATRRTETGYEAVLVGRAGRMSQSPYPSRARTVNPAGVR